MEVPLMHSDDPFYAFKDELHVHVSEATNRFSKWKTLLETTDTSSNLEFKKEMGALKKELVNLQSNVNDLEQVLQRVQTHRSSFPHITDEELVKRQKFIKEIKNEVNSMKSAMNSPNTAGKIEHDKRQNLMHRSQKQNDDVNNSTSNNSFIQDEQQQQELIMRQQDEHLDALGEGATRLGHVAVAIKEEIDEQNLMLDNLQDDMDTTSGRMDQVLGRVDKLLKTDSRWQTNTILTLILVLVVLILLVAWT